MRDEPRHARDCEAKPLVAPRQVRTAGKRDSVANPSRPLTSRRADEVESEPLTGGTPTPLPKPDSVMTCPARVDTPADRLDLRSLEGMNREELRLTVTLHAHLTTIRRGVRVWIGQRARRGPDQPRLAVECARNSTYDLNDEAPSGVERHQSSISKHATARAAPTTRMSRPPDRMELARAVTSPYNFVSLSTRESAGRDRSQFCDTLPPTSPAAHGPRDEAESELRVAPIREESKLLTRER